MESLKKGALDVIILNILDPEDSYGYDIINRINAQTSDAFKFKVGTLYPLLHRLEEAKLLESYWTKSTSAGAKRKYYHLTKKGKKELEKRRAEWTDFRQNVDMLLKPA